MEIRQSRWISYFGSETGLLAAAPIFPVSPGEGLMFSVVIKMPGVKTMNL